MGFSENCVDFPLFTELFAFDASGSAVWIVWGLFHGCTSPDANTSNIIVVMTSIANVIQKTIRHSVR